MNYAEFHQQLEQTIAAVIRAAYPASWDESHITFSLVEQLFKRHQVESINGLDRPFKIVWDFRKLRRPEETDFGDIAILVNLTTWASEQIEGVGLLEAKRRDLDKSTFSATTTSQLRRLAGKAPSAQLVLYDYDNVSACMDNSFPQFPELYYGHRHRQAVPYTHVVCVPIRTALARGKYNTELHKFGVPFSNQILGRYFRGFDLETSAKTLEAVKGNIGRHGGARTIVLVGISTGNAEPTLPEVNNTVYGRD